MCVKRSCCNFIKRHSVKDVLERSGYNNKKHREDQRFLVSISSGLSGLLEKKMDQVRPRKPTTTTYPPPPPLTPNRIPFSATQYSFTKHKMFDFYPNSERTLGLSVVSELLYIFF